MPNLLIHAEAVEAAFLSCLFAPEEIVEGKAPEGAVIVEGITNKFGFHPQRLEAIRETVTRWLRALPTEFLQSGGGGWSFLNACNQVDGRQWADFHRHMEQLFCLGLGLGLVKSQIPRDMWDVLPGGMPYYVVLL